MYSIAGQVDILNQNNESQECGQKKSKNDPKCLNVTNSRSRKPLTTFAKFIQTRSFRPYLFIRLAFLLLTYICIEYILNLFKEFIS